MTLNRGATFIVAVVLTACFPSRVELTSEPVGLASPAASGDLATTASNTQTPSITQTPAVTFTETLAEVEYRLPLTIRHVTDSTAVLFFELATPSSGVVAYAPEGSLQSNSTVVALDETREAQMVTLGGLTPATLYEVRVGIATGQEGAFSEPSFLGESWGPVTFQTASNEEPVRVGLVGDPGFGDASTATLAQEMSAFDLDFVIVAGDVVYNIGDNSDPYEAFAQKYYSPFAPLLQTMPFYPVVGNHDVEAAAWWGDAPFYYHAFPAFDDPLFEPASFEGRNQWYAFARGDVQFVMLDTQTFFNESGRAEQTAWLAERLADERFLYTIPAFHVAPYTSGRHTFDGLAVRSDWQPLFEAVGVPLVLSGHDHNYERLSLNGITYLVSGGGSARLYPLTIRLPESLIFAQETHFVILEVYSDHISVEAVALGGSIIDQATVNVP